MHQLSRSGATIGMAMCLLLGAILLDVVADAQLSGIYGTAVIVASVSLRPRATAVVAALAVTAAVVSGVWHGAIGDWAWSVRLASCVIAGVAAVVAAGLAERYRRTMRHTTQLAQDLLDALAVELTGARTVTEVADAFVNQAARRLGATSAMIFLADEHEVMRSVAWLGRGGSQADEYTEFSLRADLPGAEAARTRTPLHLPDRAAIYAAFPSLEGYYPEDRSLHLLPLVDGDSLQGLLGLTFPPTVIGSDAERGLLLSLAAALSTALSRAATLMAADAEVRRTAILAEASRALSRSLDWDETLAEISRLLVPDLADWCALSRVHEGTLETTAVWHRDPETAAWAQSMRNVFPVNMSATSGAPAVVRTGRPELYTSVPQELLESTAVSEEHAALLKRLGLVSVMIAPMVDAEASGEGPGTTGAVSLAYAESGRHYGPEDIQLLTDLASRIGTALRNAESFTRQSRRLTEVTRVAAAAQQAILSPPPPQLGPLSIGTRYVSAADEAQVGGDLYEVVAREGRVRVLIGDVRGKGLSAIRAATIVLGGFRSVSIQDLPLAEVARQLDHHVRSYVEDDEDFVTAALVDIEYDGRFSLVLCGHPAPLVTHDGGWRLVDAEPTAPLGLGSDPVVAHGVLTPGDRMLLFTDGLLEARGPDRSFIEPDRLWDLAASTPFPVLLDTLLEELHAWTGGPLQDDLALLSLRYLQSEGEESDPAAGTSPTSPVPGGLLPRLDRVLPQDGASVGEARRLLRDMLAGTGLERVVDDVSTAVSEIVTNALVHAGSEVYLAAALTGSGLRVEVGDASPHLPVRRDYAATSVTGRGLHIVQSVVTRWGAFRLGSGKVVWFEIEDPAGDPFAEQPPSAASEASAEDLVEVALLDVPLLMHAAWQEHTAALLREHLLVRLGDDLAVLDAHAAASDALNVLYEQVPAPVLGEDPTALMSDVIEPHVSQAVLTLRVPRRSVPSFAVLERMVGDALELATTGQMLVPPTQPEMQALCRWLCDEVREQAGTGREPRPWRAPQPEQVTDIGELAVAGFDPGEVSSSARGLMATNDASVIVAVSPSVVRFLGYRAESELVGRPIICVVPTRYHQAHIAGTTLNAVNGRDPLLGVRITVPVVRAGGDEVPVELEVVARQLPAGTRIFLAEFHLVPDDLEAPAP